MGCTKKHYFEPLNYIYFIIFLKIFIKVHFEKNNFR